MVTPQIEAARNSFILYFNHSGIIAVKQSGLALTLCFRLDPWVMTDSFGDIHGDDVARWRERSRCLVVLSHASELLPPQHRPRRLPADQTPGQPPHPSHAAQQHCDNRAILYQPRHQLCRRGAPRSFQKGQVIAVHLTTRKPRKPPSIPRHGVSMVSPEVTFSLVFTAFAASHGVTMVSSWRFSVDPPG